MCFEPPQIIGFADGSCFVENNNFFFFFLIASKYENESLVQDAMRLPPLKLQSKAVCRVQNKDKGYKTKKTKANQKPFKASCNHLGLTELEREGERIPWARVDDHRS